MTSILIARLPPHPKSSKAIEFMQENGYFFRITSNSPLANLLMSSGKVENSVVQILGFCEEFKPGKEEIQIVKELMKEEIDENHQERGDSIVQPGNEEKQKEMYSDGMESVFETMAEETAQENTANIAHTPTIDSSFTLPVQSKNTEKVAKNMSSQQSLSMKTVQAYDDGESDHHELAKIKEKFNPNGLDGAAVDEEVLDLALAMESSHGDFDQHRIEFEDGMILDELLEPLENGDNEDLEEEEDYFDEEEECDNILEITGDEDGEESSKKKSSSSQGHRLFNCPFKNCTLCYNTFNDLSEHMKHHSYSEHILCNVCKKEFIFVSEAGEHMRKRERRECCRCGKRFSSTLVLLDHYRLHASEEPFRCETCEKRFSFRSDLLTHMGTHVDEEITLKCCLCEERFNCLSHLKQHILLHMKNDRNLCIGTDSSDNMKINEGGNDDEVADLEDKKKKTGCVRLLFACSVKNCPSSFKEFKQLQEHVNVHIDCQDYFCDVCKQTFTSKDTALAHTQEREKRECCGCGKKFSTLSVLLQHLCCHTREKPFVCKTCGQRYSKLLGLNCHMLAHTQEQSFVCGFCRKPFSSKRKLNRHELIHPGMKPFECSHCGRRFRDSSNLATHIRIHTDEKPYSCKNCDMKFSQSGSLKRHVESKHQS